MASRLTKTLTYYDVHAQRETKKAKHRLTKRPSVVIRFIFFSIFSFSILRLPVSCFASLRVEEMLVLFYAPHMLLVGQAVLSSKGNPL